MSYAQLTREQRYQIYALMKVGHNQKKQRKRYGGHIRRHQIHERRGSTRVEKRLNNRSRKTLGYRPPNEVFFKERSVAFQI